MSRSSLNSAERRARYTPVKHILWNEQRLITVRIFISYLLKMDYIHKQVKEYRELWVSALTGILRIFNWFIVSHYTVPEHTTPTSSWCPHSPSPHSWNPQLHRDVSFPSHSTSFSHMDPVPGPNQAGLWVLRASPHCSCLHTTCASRKSHESSHTVPHEPPWRTSSLPAQSPPEPTSRMELWAGLKIPMVPPKICKEEEIYRHFLDDIN